MLLVRSLRLGDMDGVGRQDLVFMGRDPADGRAYLAMRPGLAAGGFGPTRRLQVNLPSSKDRPAALLRWC